MWLPSQEHQHSGVWLQDRNLCVIFQVYLKAITTASSGKSYGESHTPKPQTVHSQGTTVSNFVSRTQAPWPATLFPLFTSLGQVPSFLHLWQPEW